MIFNFQPFRPPQNFPTMLAVPRYIPWISGTDVKRNYKKVLSIRHSSLILSHISSHPATFLTHQHYHHSTLRSMILSLLFKFDIAKLIRHLVFDLINYFWWERRTFAWCVCSWNFHLKNSPSPPLPPLLPLYSYPFSTTWVFHFEWSSLEMFYWRSSPGDGLLLLRGGWGQNLLMWCLGEFFVQFSC